MPSKNVISIGAKIELSFMEYLRNKALQENKSMSELVREALNGDRKAYEYDKIAEKLQEITFLYDVTPEKIVSAIDYLLANGKLHVIDGKIHWNPTNYNSEYISVDEAIGMLQISEREKDQLKHKIIENLQAMIRQDDTGNGAGV